MINLNIEHVSTVISIVFNGKNDIKSDLLNICADTKQQHADSFDVPTLRKTHTSLL